MNNRSLYLEIGNIDDDLILEAAEARGHKIRKIYFAGPAAVAACLCLIYAALFFTMHRDVIYYNDAPAPVASKILVPSDENTTILMLSYKELFAYYGLTPLPNRLLCLRRIEQDQFFLYETPENGAYDTNLINYRSEDGLQTLSILIKKEDAAQKDDIRKSRIDGVSLMLAVSEGPTQPVYWAEIYHDGILMRLVSSGMTESTFTDLIRELIQCLN